MSSRRRFFTLLSVAVMVLSAACLLLLVGGLSLLPGDSGLYRSEPMLAMGIVVALLSLWGGWRIAAGKRVQLLFGLASTFFTVAGVVVFWQYGGKAVSYAMLGGAMWFGALGMACTAMVGVLFCCIFGYFARKLMQPRLWLAGAHWSLSLVALGAYLDYCGEVTASVQLPSNGRVMVAEVMTMSGDKIALPFTLRVDSFSITGYGEETYSLYRREGEGWEFLGNPEVMVDSLKYSDELWAIEDLQISPDMPQPFLLLPETPEQPARLLMRNPSAVKSYSATCHIETEHRGRPESRDEVVRVNEPLECKGWLVYLNSYSPMNRSTLVTLQLRRAPGRMPALAGMVGVILCTAFWCWRRREDAPQPVETSTCENIA